MLVRKKSNMAKNIKTEPDHPYYPKDVVFPTTYKPNVSSTTEILAVFFGIVGVILIITYILASRKKCLTFLGRLKVCWFILCSLIHIVLEGYFSFFWQRIVGDQSYLAQTCK